MRNACKHPRLHAYKLVPARAAPKCALVMDWFHSLEFASDATLLALTGAGCWVLAAICLLAEHLRVRTRSVERLEKVGFMPWTALFMAFAIVGGGCLAMSLPVVLGNL